MGLSGKTSDTTLRGERMYQQAQRPGRDVSTPSGRTDMEDRAIETLRFLSADAVERAGSGHPGTAVALAPVAFALFQEEMRHNPSNPDWFNRDRFVLSAGHASMLLYGALHLSGYALPLSEIRRLRRWASLAPGHPERGVTPGVEMTTGPLGQGLANAVGLALAERLLATRFNRPGFPVVDHRTYAICSDGDMMEGVTSEASSFAGHLGLGRLCVIYDDNRITIEGPSELAFSEDVGARYGAYGWDVHRLSDGWTLGALRERLAVAREDEDRPSLIIVRTHIAEGAPTKQDTREAHGSPLGAAEIREMKRARGWDPDQSFVIPPGVAEYMDRSPSGARAEADWQALLEGYTGDYPALAADLKRVLRGGSRPEISLPHFGDVSTLATRAASGDCLRTLTRTMPDLVGGSADLGPSTSTETEGELSIRAGSFGGSRIHFGVREHAMGAILNGLAAHGGIRPFGGTFLTFSDYMRPAIRLASMMGLPVIYLFTHDSIGLGEDGPTHQPIEHLASLRAIPGLTVIRPCDAAETAVAWRFAIEHRQGPIALILTRQDVPVLDRRTLASANGLTMGGYTLARADIKPEAVLIATGSEVHVMLAASEALETLGIRSRVVSMPIPDRFLAQDLEYREHVLPPDVPRVSLEAASTFGWERIVGPRGVAIGIDHFGASAPGEELMERFGISAARVVSAVVDLL
jgi:transketolase